MMAGNPNWWNMNIPPPSPPPSSSPPPPLALLHSPFFQYAHLHQYAFGSSPSHPFSSFAAESNSHELPPQSWSQLLLGGLSGEEAASHKLGPTPSFFQTRKFGSWAEDQSILNDESSTGIHVKQEQVPQHGNLYVQHEELPSGHKPVTVWPTARMIPVSSPSSSVTTLSSSNNTVLDFSSNISKGDHGSRNNQNQDHSSSECKSTATGGACKKARVQTSSNPPLKVRKEKLGDRITALHQLVSPFGKTDTASVLLEAIGYIRFLQSQIEALSSPYLGNASGNLNHQRPENGDNNLPKDLRSRGLCLVPVSCTMQVGNDNGADYWAPAAFGGGF